MAVDTLAFGEALCTLPEQLAAAHEAAGMIDAAQLPNAADVDNIVVLGMGGSGISGNVLQAMATASVPVPLVVLKQYRTPAFVGPRTLVFAMSYSGGTEETLEMARGALALVPDAPALAHRAPPSRRPRASSRCRAAVSCGASPRRPVRCTCRAPPMSPCRASASARSSRRCS